MPTEKRLARVREVASQRQKGLVVVLEDIHDPHNAEAVIRSAEAFGVPEVYFIFNKEERFNPRRIGKKSSSSGNKWVEFKSFTSPIACVKELKKKGYTVVATALSPNAKEIYAAKLAGKAIALVFGNEAMGISEEMRDAADMLVTIPMRGMVQSLNLSVTAGIVLYEVTRTRMKKMKQYLLNSREVNALTKRMHIS